MIYYNYTRGYKRKEEGSPSETERNHIEKLGRFQLDKDEVVLTDK